MRKAIRVLVYSLAALLVLDATLAVLGIPSFISGEDLEDDWTARIVVALLAVSNIRLIVRPRPGGFVLSAAVIIGAIAFVTRHDTAVIAWIAISFLVFLLSRFDFVADRRTRRVEAIYARIEEEIVDSSLTPRHGTSIPS